MILRDTVRGQINHTEQALKRLACGHYNWLDVRSLEKQIEEHQLLSSAIEKLTEPEEEAINIRLTNLKDKREDGRRLSLAEAA